MSARAGPAKITSTDINPDKYSISNLEAMRVAFPQCEDEELARYLIARNDDLDKAKAQLQKALDWRAGFFPIMKEDCGDEFQAGKLISYGEDKEGRPVMFWNARLNIGSERDLEKLAKTVVWWTEYTIRRMPPQYSKFTILMDRVGFTRENADMDFAKHVSSIMQDAYPERVYQIIIYPADFVFYTIWNIGKWFLDPVTRNKVKPMLQFVGVEQFVERQYILKNMGGDADFEFDGSKYEELWPVKKEEAAEAAAATDA